jgi:hypothetical protein
MKILMTCVLIAAAPAWAQAPAATKDQSAASLMCGECGVVRSVRAVTKEAPPVPSDASKPSGLVASVPFGGGKPYVGSSTHAGGRDAVASVTTWEVIVRLDDGRFSVVTLDEPGDWREGDKVRIDGGRLRRRGE